MSDGPRPRDMWLLLEPYHAVTYFAQECRDAYKDAGLKGFWMGYFAGRAAPLGMVNANVVTALFYNFAPSMVERSIPDAWQFAGTDDILKARITGVDRALLRLLGDSITSVEVERAAEIATDAVSATNRAGRPIFAGNAGLPDPDATHLRLWQAATCLREHRGDGHIAALVGAQLDGCEAHVTFVGTGAISRSALQENRVWTDEQWSEASKRLIERGLLNADGTLTKPGVDLRRAIEADTDRLAREPWDAVGPERTAQLASLLGPIASKIASSGIIPTMNPMGLPPK